MKATYQGKVYNVAKAGAGYNFVSEQDPNMSMMMTEEEYKNTGLPTIASVQASEFASKALGVVTIASEFGEDLYPIQAGEIRAGDQVYVKPIRSFGSVIRIVGDEHRVEVDTKDGKAIQPYFLEELEKRSKE
jgi:hypothetical protein